MTNADLVAWMSVYFDFWGGKKREKGQSYVVWDKNKNGLWEQMCAQNAYKEKEVGFVFSAANQKKKKSSCTIQTAFFL